VRLLASKEVFRRFEATVDELAAWASTQRAANPDRVGGTEYVMIQSGDGERQEAADAKFEEVSKAMDALVVCMKVHLNEVAGMA